MLTQQRLKELLSYDQGTGIFIWSTKKSKRIKIGDIAGCKNPDGYIYIRVDGKGYFAHRLAWLYVYEKMPEKEIDHINEIRDDNRMCNLRLANHQENGQNQSNPRTHNTSGFLGVSWHKCGKKWRAYITLNGKIKHLGYFNTAEEAHAAYLCAKREYHLFWVEKQF